MLCSLQLKQGLRELKKYRKRWQGCYKGTELFPYKEQLNRPCLEPEEVTEENIKTESGTAWRKKQFVAISESTKVKENQMKPAGYSF